jgi:hypothetical protein
MVPMKLSKDNGGKGPSRFIENCTLPESWFEYDKKGTLPPEKGGAFCISHRLSFAPIMAACDTAMPKVV